MVCSKGYEGDPECLDCAQGYWADVSGSVNICYPCGRTSTLILILLVVVAMYTLAALVIAVLNVKAGVNRKSIHSLVFKLALAYLAGVKTYQAFLAELLPFSVTRKSSNGMDLINWFSLGFVGCLVPQDHSFPVRFRDGILLLYVLPVMIAFVATLLAGILILIAQPKNRGYINRKRRLADLLKKKDIRDVADEVGKAINESRTCGIWRYTSYDGLDPASWLARFLKDMLPTYIAIGVLLYSTQLTRLSHLINCTSLPTLVGSSSSYSYNPVDQFAGSDWNRPLVTALRAENPLSAAPLHRRVQRVPTVICDLSDPTFKVYTILAWSLSVLWGVGVPVMCFSLLRPHSHQLSKPQILQVYGFLHNGYTQTCWFFEMVFFARKAAIALGPVLTNDTTTYTQMSIMISIFFLAIHRNAVPFDRRNLNILNKLDVGGLLCWCSSLTIVVIAESLSGPLPHLLAFVIIVINAAYVLWLSVALHQEIGNWCRGMKMQNSRVPLLGCLVKMYAEASERRKEAEPRVMLLASLYEIGLGATKKGAKVEGSSDKVKMYKNGIPQPPGPSERKYLVQCLVDTFSYFLSKLRSEKINGEMALYILRTALIRSSQRSVVTMEKSALTDMPESEHAAFVESLKLQRAKREEAELARLQKLQNELDAYFAGKDTTQTTVKVDDDVTSTKQSVSLAALFESPALQQSLPLSDFYALIYQLGHTSQDTARFEKYQAIKFIHERKLQDSQRQKFIELKQLHDELVKTLNSAAKIEIENHGAQIENLRKKLAYLESTLEFCLYRPLDFIQELTRQEDLGLDPLARRLESVG